MNNTFNENLCRTCLRQDGSLETIFKTDDGCDSSSIAEIINTYIPSSLHITENDEFPNKICLSCSQKFLEFHKFKISTERNQKVLRSQLPKEHPCKRQKIVFDTGILHDIKQEWSIDEDEHVEESIIMEEIENCSDFAVKKEVDWSTINVDDQSDNIEDRQENSTSQICEDPLANAYEYIIKQEERTIKDDDWQDVNSSEDDVSQDMMNTFETDNNIYEIEETCSTVVPSNSKYRYETAYKNFKRWLDIKKVEINEKTLLLYFIHRNKILKSPGSMWSEYSMLKTMIMLNHNIRISEFKKILAFLKAKNIGYSPKKSKMFTREEMNKFLRTAPDEQYLLMKVVMIMGIAGACRRDELVKLTIDDIDDQNSVIVITIPTSKTCVPRTFTILDKPDEEQHFLNIFRKYQKLRPKNCASPRFFYTYYRGKCINQVVGINTMGKIPSKIAQFLSLETPNLYTGHAFRRSAATFLADKCKFSWSKTK